MTPERTFRNGRTLAGSARPRVSPGAVRRSCHWVGAPAVSRMGNRLERLPQGGVPAPGVPAPGVPASLADNNSIHIVLGRAQEPDTVPADDERVARPGVRPVRWRYGYDLGVETGLKAGSLYPILVRLADRGLLDAGWEESPPHGRPARHLYRLTAAGQELAAVPAPDARPQRSGSAEHRLVRRPQPDGP